MKKKISLTFIACSFFALTSCFSRVSETFDSGEYLNGEIGDLYYHRSDFSDVTSLGETTIDSSLYWNGICFGDYTSTLEGYNDHQGLNSRVPEVLNYRMPNGEIITLDEATYTIDDQPNASSFIGRDFGRTKCLAEISDDFKEAGIVSKLYDGQLLCYTHHSEAFLCLDQNGINFSFPKTMEEGETVLFVLRGGSNIGARRQVVLDLNLEFFYEEAGNVVSYKVIADDVYIPTDAGGDFPTFFGFPLEEAGLSSEGIIGVGLSFSDFRDLSFDGEESILDDEKDGNHFGLLAYEIMFPDSTWN